MRHLGDRDVRDLMLGLAPTLDTCDVPAADLKRTAIRRLLDHGVPIEQVIAGAESLTPRRRRRGDGEARSEVAP